MKANDIRFGNRVIYRGNETIINDTEIVHFMRFPETYKPIPLTEEWLLKFGFMDVTGVDYILHIDIDFKLILIPANGFYPQIDKADDSGWQSIGLNKLEFVHQIQNLYFTLTGDELEITKE